MPTSEAVWSGASALVDVSMADRIAVLRIVRPEKLNALTVEMLKDIGEGLRAFGSGDSAEAIVITGEGRAFSAGDDLKATEELDDAGFKDLIESFQALTLAVLRSEVPVIAALNGLVVGGAAEWVLACDARIGCPEMFFLFPENGVGLTISNASTYLLPRLLGGRGLPLVLNGERIPGEEAVRLGLVDELVASSADVLPRALDVARHWTRPGVTTALHLKLLRPPMAEIERAIAYETEIAHEVWKGNFARPAIERFFSSREDAEGR